MIHAVLSWNIKETKVEHVVTCGVLLDQYFPRPEWIKCISSEVDQSDIRFQFILVYKVEDGFTWNSLQDATESDNLLGYILVNNKDSFELPAGFLDSDPPSNLPLYILTTKTGEIFLSMVSGHDPGGVEVKVTKGSSAGTLPMINTVEAQEDEGLYLILLIGVINVLLFIMFHIIGQASKWPFAKPKSQGFSLSKPLKSYFSNSFDLSKGLFSYIVAHFHKFETQVSIYLMLMCYKPCINVLF